MATWSSLTISLRKCFMEVNHHVCKSFQAIPALGMSQLSMATSITEGLAGKCWEESRGLAWHPGRKKPGRSQETWPTCLTLSIPDPWNPLDQVRPRCPGSISGWLPAAGTRRPGLFAAAKLSCTWKVRPSSNGIDSRAIHGQRSPYRIRWWFVDSNVDVYWHVYIMMWYDM